MIVGLVGKSCSGKNHIGAILEGMGLEVWDTDRICHGGLDENIEEVIRVFGREVLDEEDGRTVVSRRKLGRIVFSDHERLRDLESILYPWLMEKVLSWKNANPEGLLVLNGALLYRGGFHRLCSAIIYVDAPYEVRLERAMKRDGITKEQFDLREASQADVDYREVDYGVPVFTIVNNGMNSEEDNRQVFDICAKLKAL